MSIEIKTLSITINGVTYAGKVERVESEPRRRLVFVLNRPFEHREESARLDEIHLARVKTFQSIFAAKFPDAPKFGQTSTLCGAYSEWKYYFVGAQREHIAWAQITKECGLIDSYYVEVAE